MTLNAKALEAARVARDACYPWDSLEATITAYLSSLPQAGVSEDMVEALRKASQTVKRYIRAGYGDDVFMADLCETDRTLDAALSSQQEEADASTDLIAAVRTMADAIWPFAQLAKPRYPNEGGAPSHIDILTAFGEFDELELRTRVGTSAHSVVLDAEDFRKAMHADAALEAALETSRVAPVSQKEDEPVAPYKFRRFVDGIEMAEDVEINRAASTDKAFRKARALYGNPKGMDLILEVAASPVPADAGEPQAKPANVVEARVSLMARTIRQTLRDYGHNCADTSLPEYIANDVEGALRSALVPTTIKAKGSGKSRTVVVPRKPTDAMMYAAACAHYDKQQVDAAGGIDGISMTSNMVDYNFRQAFMRIWSAALSVASRSKAKEG